MAGALRRRPRALARDYPEGSEAFFALLRDCRESGKFEGIELSCSAASMKRRFWPERPRIVRERGSPPGEAKTLGANERFNLRAEYLRRTDLDGERSSATLSTRDSTSHSRPRRKKPPDDIERLHTAS